MAATGRVPLQRTGSDASDPHPPSSRSSVVGAPPMPSIAEDEVAYRLSVTSRHPHVVWPKGPLRVPHKSPRRALVQAQAAAASAASETAAGSDAPTLATPTSTAPAPTSTSTNATGPPSPPPYAPVTHLPPLYKEKLPSESSESEDAQRAIGAARLSSTSSHSAAARPATPPATGEAETATPLDEKNFKFGWRDRQWFGSRRARWCKFMSLGLLVIAIIVGLAVGLTLGLKDRGAHPLSNESDDDKPDPVFPAGSYSFETTLRRESTACTSRSSTWRCYPYNTGSNATFFWAIDRSPSDPGSLVVSGSENPFAPSFSNLPTSVLNPGHSDERLIFEFDMDKTVVPEDALTPQNRAAKCTFGGTKFQATLWTRRGGGEDEADTSEKFGAWPGDVEIIQSKGSEPGEPKCEDESGNVIADVQASIGDCTCDYANFELD